MNNKPDHNAIVAKKHVLIDKMAKYKLQELRLIAYCLAHYDSRKADNRKFQASVEDLNFIYPSMDEKSAYSVIRGTVLGLGSKPLEFEINNIKYYWNWFSGFSYTKGEGLFKFYISPELQPYLLELKGTFTRYRLQDVYQFKSAATWKLYEHLKKYWSRQNSWSVNIDELKIKLGILGKYSRWQDLKKYVIDPATREINKHSDITVTYEKQKHVRRVIGVVFSVDSKQPDDVITIESQREEIFKLLLTHGINEKTAKDYAEKTNQSGRINQIIKKIPGIKKRWENIQKDKKKGPLQKYLLGAITHELNSPDLPFGETPPKPKAVHSEAYICWQKKRRTGEKCSVRQRGVPGQRKKCQICLETITIKEWGI